MAFGCHDNLPDQRLSPSVDQTAPIWPLVHLNVKFAVHRKAPELADGA